MSEGIIVTNKNNFLFLFVLILGLSLHLFLGKLIFDNMRSFGIAFGIALGFMLVLFGLHITIGRKLYHKGGVTQ